MATYASLRAVGAALAADGAVPTELTEALVAVGEILVADTHVSAIYQPLFTVLRQAGDPRFGPTDTAEAWSAIRKSLGTIRPNGDAGEWLFGATTVNSQPDVVGSRPELFAPALTVAGVGGLESTLDRLANYFPEAEFVEDRGWTTTISGVDIFIFENDPDEHDALYADGARATDWTWLRAGGADTGPTQLPAASPAIAPPNQGLLGFLRAACDAKRSLAGARDAARAGPRSLARWLAVSRSFLVTEVAAPLDLDPIDRDAVLEYLASTDARWNSLTYVCVPRRDAPKVMQREVAAYDLVSGAQRVRVVASHHDLDDDSGSLILTLTTR